MYSIATNLFITEGRCDQGSSFPLNMSHNYPWIWESQLFPKTDSGFRFAEINGFKLPDFSHAGYHKGEKKIPDVAVKKTIRPLNGDNSQHIQTALYEASGGALLLLPGRYSIKSEIIIPGNTVLRGSGPDSTFIYVDLENTRQMSALVGNRSQRTTPPLSRWKDCEYPNGFDIIGDVKKGETRLLLETVSDLDIADWIVVKNEVTDYFRWEYNGTTQIAGQTIWPSDESSLKFLRRIVGIIGFQIIIDQPVPHILNACDNPHILKLTCMAEEIGVENLSIGFKSPNNLLKYKDVAGKDTPFHNSAAIKFGNVANGWIRNVKSYSPADNNIHLHSRGIVLQNSRWITVKDCDFGYPIPSMKSGGNGYVYVITMSNDCLIQNCIARSGRHNYHLANSSGNVISACKSFDCRARNDFHHSLSVANLIENMQMTCNSNYQEAFVIQNRGKASMGAGITGTDNVFWKIHILTPGKIIVSEQAHSNGGKGYVIGVTSVGDDTETTDSEWREGIGRETGLRPVSLYYEQLKLRLNR